jgi:hypothetical protein
MCRCVVVRVCVSVHRRGLRMLRVGVCHWLIGRMYARVGNYKISGINRTHHADTEDMMQTHNAEEVQTLAENLPGSERGCEL